MRKISILLMVYTLFLSPLHAGAWGVGIYENDDALDWLNELDRQNKIKSANYHSYIESTFLRVIKNKGYIQVDDCGGVIAAGAVVAAALDKNLTGLTPMAKKLVLRNKNIDLTNIKEIGVKAINKCINSKSSEIRGLWKDSKSYPEWLLIINKMYKRLE